MNVFDLDIIAIISNKLDVLNRKRHNFTVLPAIITK